jgi:anti-sigma factor RsiW
MTCKQAQPLIDAYLDQELSVADSARMDAHLAVCDACRLEVNEARVMKRLLSNAPDVEIPVGFEERLVQRVMRPASVHTTRSRLSFGWVALAGAAAAAATFAFLSARPQDAPVAASPNALARDIGQDLTYTAGGDPLGPRGVFLSTYDPR